MIKKDKFLDFLRKAYSLEEQGLPIYTRHLSNTLFLSGFAKDVQEEIKDTLLLLKKESERHKEIFETIINKVKESSQDVY